MAIFSREKPQAAVDWQAIRPLSPHLSIYRLTITMVMSIVHRLTGVALYFGMILLAAWLLAAAMGPDWYGVFGSLVDNLFGRAVLIGFTWALLHHMLGGIRHLIWDTGRGLDLVSIDILAWATLLGSLALTAALWVGASLLGIA